MRLFTHATDFYRICNRSSNVSYSSGITSVRTRSLSVLSIALSPHLYLADKAPEAKREASELPGSRGQEVGLLSPRHKLVEKSRVGIRSEVEEVGVPSEVAAAEAWGLHSPRVTCLLCHFSLEPCDLGEVSVPRPSHL